LARGIDCLCAVPTQWREVLSTEETDHCVGYPVGVDAVVTRSRSDVQATAKGNPPPGRR